MQITPNIHRIGGMVNQYLIIDGKELTLIDTGMASNVKNILKYIDKNGFHPEAVKRILITHSDPDHYGAADEVKKVTGAAIWTSQVEADAMKTGTSSRPIAPSGFLALFIPLLSKFLSTPPTQVDVIIQNGDILPVLDGLNVIASPGHTPGHLSFYYPKDRVLFAGDAINSHNGKPIPTTDDTTYDQVQARASFEVLMQLKPSVICCGHAYFDLRN